jgi:protein-disulfide isomerase
LYENQDALEDENLSGYAAALGLDANQLMREVKAHAYAARIAEDFRSGARHDVNGTPTFFINGLRYNGAPGIAELLAALTAEPAR